MQPSNPIQHQGAQIVGFVDLPTARPARAESLVRFQTAPLDPSADFNRLLSAGLSILPPPQPSVSNRDYDLLDLNGIYPDVPFVPTQEGTNIAIRTFICLAKASAALRDASKSHFVLGEIATRSISAALEALRAITEAYAKFELDELCDKITDCDDAIDEATITISAAAECLNETPLETVSTKLLQRTIDAIATIETESNRIPEILA